MVSEMVVLIEMVMLCFLNWVVVWVKVLIEGVLLVSV